MPVGSVMPMAKAHPFVALLVAGSAVYSAVVLAKTDTPAGWLAAVGFAIFVALAWLGAEWLWRRHDRDLALSVLGFVILVLWAADLVAGALTR
jgi:hypothetical protein